VAKLVFPKISIIKEQIAKINDKEKDSKISNDLASQNKNESKLEFSNISIEGEKKDDESYMENQLSLLFQVFKTSYSKSSYRDLIKDIEEKEELLFKGSIMSFNIMIIKVKCLIKELLSEYNQFLKLKNVSFYEIDSMIHIIHMNLKKFIKL
jgi:hypothetical protein